MKKLVRSKILKFLRMVPLAAAVCLAGGCGGATTLPNFQKMEKVAGKGESEIIIILGGGVRYADVSVDGQRYLRLSRDSEEMKSGTIIVPNGVHNVACNINGRKLTAFQPIPIPINFQSNRVVIQVDRSLVKVIASLALDPISAMPGISAAMRRAGSALVNELPGGSKIAVISVASNNADISSLVLGEIEYLLVSAKRFTMVNRGALDDARQERSLKIHSEMNDEALLAIGHLVGASVVVSGSVTMEPNSGSGTLTLRALGVSSGQVVAMARETY